MTNNPVKMKIPKPDVPKRLAARLRASYRRVLSARDKIAYVEAKSRYILMELEDYETDPHHYAMLHYPSAPDPADYPTVTHTLRLQVWLEDKAMKIPRYHEELLSAEQQMDETESGVLKEVQQIRANTRGRESWPASPTKLLTLRKQWERIYAKEYITSTKFMAERLERRKKFAEEQKLERIKFLNEINEEIRFKANTMTPVKAAAFISMMEVLQERMFGDKLSLTDFYDIAQGESSLMKEIINEAESRAIIKLNSQKS
ncbi:hypothetical protein [Brenneria corticis]|nr:hypothetical protein [Brenneria sp. CFCC 11842]